MLAQESYAKYQGIVDKMAVAAQDGVEFRMCNNALHAAGFKPQDTDGLVTVIPAGFAAVVDLDRPAYQYVNPLATPRRRQPLPGPSASRT